MPIGVEDDSHYVPLTVPVSPDGRLLMVSDGIIEQFEAPGDTPSTAQFGLDGIDRVIRAAAADTDVVAALFDAVVKHAGRPKLSDDATAVLVKWEGNQK